MAEKTFSLEFNGWWREGKSGNMPTTAGVYGFHACVYDEQAKTVDLKRLLYIGQAEDLTSRIGGHDGWNDFKSALKSGEVLCVNVAKVATADLDRVEAALVYINQPPKNGTLKTSFAHDTTTIQLSGRYKMIKPGTAKKST
ncbi:GIY-YIG nuclease family protein [bacterium]|nr:GIY-YIG nuclease family protein [bacterium]